MAEPAAAQKPKRVLYRFPVELGPDELAELGNVLSAEVTAHHLRWLETGEGTPWPESSD
ncbi:MAG TPA: hypothetical protein VGM29_00065 [Polyangiaceae bacterium]|jgi:hypothetical protein